MKTPITALAVSALLLAACGESRLNPFNWFKRAERVEVVRVPAAAEGVVIDRSGLINQVIDLKIEQTPGGAIIRAIGLPPTQGYWNAELLPVNDEIPVDGVLIYRFSIEKPPGFERVVNQRSREVFVAHQVSNIALDGVRAIRVVGTGNDLISRR